MSRTWLLLLVAGCASLEPVHGVVLDRATEDFIDEGRKRALAAVFLRACMFADAHPDDLRAQRKVAALAGDAFRARADREHLLGLARPALTRLISGPSACSTRDEAAEAFESGGWLELAAATYSRTALECGKAGSAVRAAKHLRQLDRCDEAVTLLEASWPFAHGEERIAVLDAVNDCSDETSLQANLSFVRWDVYAGYLQILANRRFEASRRRLRQQLDQIFTTAQRELQSACLSACNAVEERCASRCHVCNDCGPAAAECRAGCR